MITETSALAYDAALVIGRAASVVGTRREDIRNYLDGIGSRYPAVPGATGSLTFNKDHNGVTASFAMMQLP